MQYGEKTIRLQELLSSTKERLGEVLKGFETSDKKYDTLGCGGSSKSHDACNMVSDCYRANQSGPSSSNTPIYGVDQAGRTSYEDDGIFAMPKNGCTCNKDLVIRIDSLDFMGLDAVMRREYIDALTPGIVEQCETISVEEICCMHLRRLLYLLLESSRGDRLYHLELGTYSVTGGGQAVSCSPAMTILDHFSEQLLLPSERGMALHFVLLRLLSDMGTAGVETLCRKHAIWCANLLVEFLRR
jgi:hypothetical protein